MTDNEDLVLRLLLKSWKTSKIAEQTHLSISTVNLVRRKLLNKFGARTNLQLLILAVLDDTYFELLGKIKRTSIDLTQTERSVLILAIQGYKNSEIAEKLGVSLRTVEYKKKKFSIGNNVQFVKKTIELGLLVILPVKYKFDFIEIFGATIKVLSFERYTKDASNYLSNINHGGYIYIDYLHRFTMTHNNTFVNIDRSYYDLIQALKLSSIENKLILELFPENSEMVLNSLDSVNRRFTRKPLNRLFQELIVGKSIELVKKDKNHIDIYTQGQKILIDNLANGKSKDEIVKTLKIRPHQYEEQLEIIKSLWNAPNIMSVYLTFLHLNFLHIENKS